MRLVYKVSTCLALRRKSHLQVNKICVPEYFCHPVLSGEPCIELNGLLVLNVNCIEFTPNNSQYQVRATGELDNFEVRLSI